MEDEQINELKAPPQPTPDLINQEVLDFVIKVEGVKPNDFGKVTTFKKFSKGGKTNVVVDPLSRKIGRMGSLAHLQVSRHPLAREVQTLANEFMRLEVIVKGRFLACVEAISSFLDKIKGKQFDDEKLSRIRDMAHSSRYSIYPGANKMYHAMRKHYWWSRIKHDIVDFVSQCPNCQQVKYEHHRSGKTLQRMPIPEWKWEWIAMNFVVGLPKSLGRFDSIWVIVDRLTKSTHFIPVKVTYNVENLAKLYICEIFQLHGVLISIISDRGTPFTSNFWRTLQAEL
ncbi:uncharacterized protein LOC125840508 [Solanum verrucosum]|uniref:uncharacterized protein LOC125840508 n=1 Tax=Solanum verrucosum TaxID=315347 RepID=UPI0020D1D214|nr:uncharacterized protein LOC125840508 [Solanum verrucosum]